MKILEPIKGKYFDTIEVREGKFLEAPWYYLRAWREGKAIIVDMSKYTYNKMKENDNIELAMLSEWKRKWGKEMTKDEAIICLKGIKNIGQGVFTEQSDFQESLDMAIKALEQQPCEDCEDTMQ